MSRRKVIRKPRRATETVGFLSSTYTPSPMRARSRRPTTKGCPGFVGYQIPFFFSCFSEIDWSQSSHSYKRSLVRPDSTRNGRLGRTAPKLAAQCVGRDAPAWPYWSFWPARPALIQASSPPAFRLCGRGNWFGSRRRPVRFRPVGTAAMESPGPGRSPGSVCPKYYHTRRV